MFKCFTVILLTNSLISGCVITGAATANINEKSCNKASNNNENKTSKKNNKTVVNDNNLEPSTKAKSINNNTKSKHSNKYLDKNNSNNKTVENNKKVSSKSSLDNKKLKDNNKMNIVIIKQEELNILQNFLQGETKKYTKCINKESVNKKDVKNRTNITDINNVLKNIDETNKLLTNIKTKNYESIEDLNKQINEFNEKIKRIEEFCNNLLKKKGISTNNNEINLTKSNIQWKGKGSNFQTITNLNWTKDTRNNSNVIINPLEEQNSDSLADNERIVIDISQPLTRDQVEEYYGGSNKENEVPMEGTLINKSHDDDNINNPINNNLPN